MNRRGKELYDTISADLKDLFENVARMALQGADESASDSIDILQKMRNAHARISHIVEESMRGLAKTHETMFVSGIINAVSVDEEDSDTSSSPQ